MQHPLLPSLVEAGLWGGARLSGLGLESTVERRGLDSERNHRSPQSRPGRELEPPATKRLQK